MKKISLIFICLCVVVVTFAQQHIDAISYKTAQGELVSIDYNKKQKGLIVPSTIVELNLRDLKSNSKVVLQLGDTKQLVKIKVIQDFPDGFTYCLKTFKTSFEDEYLKVVVDR